MDLTYQLKGNGESRAVRIPFDPPLAGYEEVKPRLMNMKGEAEEALGMVCLFSFMLRFSFVSFFSLSAVCALPLRRRRYVRLK